MSAQHTPAPWWVTDSGVRDRGGYICHTKPAQRYEGQQERYEREVAERAANKLLIAAAPELLAALTPFANFACSPPGECECHNCRARAAIEKATNGSTT